MKPRKIGIGLALLRMIPAAAWTVAQGFAATIDGAALQVIHSFSGVDGRLPIDHFAQDAAGRLYGASQFGGPSGDSGVVFSLRPDGSEFRILYNFTNEFTNALWPNGLMLASNGRLYGTTYRSMATFELNTDGTGFRVLRSVPFSEESRALVGPLVEGTSGVLLGAVEGIGGHGGGGIGVMNKDGTGFTETHHLASSYPCATYVQPPLVRGADGRFYGVSGSVNQQFGTSCDWFGLGKLFRVEADGTGFEVMADLGAIGLTPISPLLLASDGAFFGLAISTNSPQSLLWRANPDGGQFRVLKSFCCTGQDGAYGKLLEGADGRLYGTTRINSRFDPRVPYQFLVTSLFSINKDGSNYAYEWQEVYHIGVSNALANLRLLLRGHDNALYASGQGRDGSGTLVRFQPGNVPAAPVLLSCQTDVFAPEGSRIVFAPAVRGAAPLNYEWSFNGAVIAGATDPWLGVDRVQPTSYGTYSVTIANAYSRTQCSFELKVPGPIKLTPPHRTPHDMEFRVRGSDNLPFVIEFTSDRQTWRAIAGGELIDGRAVVLVPSGNLGAHAFFRARYLPIGLEDD